MSPSEPILCSNCQSNIDGLVAEATRGDPEYSEILQRNKTNAIPGTVRERSQMQALIDEANGTLEQCDRAIAELEEGLARLKKSRIELIRTKIAPRRSLLSPIRKLPHEVLGLVFVNLQGAGITFDGYSKMKLQGAVFGLTWVCASWRATALSQSQLWSSYRINFTAFNSPPPELPDFMKECLEVRGKNALINVSLFGISDYSTRNTAPLLELVFQSTARWIGAKISYTEPWQKKLSLLTDGTKFPLIESLNLDCYSSGIGENHEILRLIQHCPQLRYLASSHLDSSYAWVGMKNLVSMEVETITGSLTQLLIQCPFLERLKLRGCVAGQTTGQADHARYHHHHTKLSHLSISESGRGLQSGWSTGLFLPALTHLFFVDTMYDGEPAGELVNLLLRSHCSLQSISLHPCFGRLGNQIGIDQFLAKLLSVTAPDASIVILHS